jgi:endonuclease/exonuclease/phosphatase family metal-dependent hydrolase
MKLTAMSFNIRYDKPDPDERNWRVRREAVAALIVHYSPDIIGTQEACANQLLDLTPVYCREYQSLGMRSEGYRIR